MGANKYEVFEMRVIHRSQIAFADYNPRKISAEAKAKLKAWMKAHGLWSPLVWNESTGILVSGHKRLEALDTLMGTSDYELTVAVVDVEETEEVQGNVFLNNPASQGEWDYDILTQLTAEYEIDPIKDLGFNADEVSMIWGDEETEALRAQAEAAIEEFEGEQEIAAAVGDIPDAEGEPGESKSITEEERLEFRRIKAQAREKAKADNANGVGTNHSSADFFVTVVFPTAEEKREFMAEMGKPEHEKRLLSVSLYDWMAQHLGG